MKKNTNILMMAFSKGSEVTEGSNIKRYIGVAPVKVLAVNPSKKDLESIYNRDIEKEPEYIGETDGVKYARVDFIIQTDAEKCNGIDLVSKISFFLKDSGRTNKDKSKVQIIDKYGRTAWVTKEELVAKKVPQYANGPANIDADYRPLYNGEEDLTNFIKTYLGIPNVQVYVEGKWVPNPKAKAEDCEARLTSVKEMFSGDFKELQEIVTYQPNNRVKVLFGVRTTDDGKQYQAVYTQKVLSNRATDFHLLAEDLEERKNSGAYPTTEFKVVPIEEYKVEATDFTPTDDLPVSPDTSSWFK